MFSLAGKAIVVTGGGRGIGRGICRAVARAGGNLVISGRTVAALEDCAAEMREYGVATLVVPCDITQRAQLDHLVQAALDCFGYIDGWVNNAGSADPRDVGPLLTIREDGWDRVVDLNLKWTFFAAQAAARTMTRGGAIVNISSRSGSQPNPLTGPYGAAKAGIDNLTATMAVEWGHLNIRVNAVAPGLVATETSLQPEGSLGNEKRRARQAEIVPLRRVGVVDDVGPLVAFLLSDEASWISGEVIQVHGGSRIPVGYLNYLHKVNSGKIGS